MQMWWVQMKKWQIQTKKWMQKYKEIQNNNTKKTVLITIILNKREINIITPLHCRLFYSDSKQNKGQPGHQTVTKCPMQSIKIPKQCNNCYQNPLFSLFSQEPKKTGISNNNKKHRKTYSAQFSTKFPIHNAEQMTVYRAR